MGNVRPLIVAMLLLGVMGGGPAAAEGPVVPVVPVVVELFTSQSCSSCPPAEAYLGRLAGRPDVVALEWHVDYWDHLVHGFRGRWRDPFSSSAATERQRTYARRINGNARVYTPQMVVQGRTEGIGSRVAEIDRLIAHAAAAAAAQGWRVPVQAARSGAAVTVRVGPNSGGAAGVTDAGATVVPTVVPTVVLVSLLTRRMTEVSRGENHGNTLANHNIVLDARPLGTWTGPAATFTGTLAPEADACAVLLQAAGQGAILGAGYCGG